MVRMIVLALGVLAAWPAMAESGLSNEDSSGVGQWCDPAKPQQQFCGTVKPQQSITAWQPPDAPAPPQLECLGDVCCVPGKPLCEIKSFAPAQTTTITVPAGSVATFPGGQLTGPVTIEIRPATPPAPR